MDSNTASLKSSMLKFLIALLSMKEKPTAASVEVTHQYKFLKNARIIVGILFEVFFNLLGTWF